MVPVLVGRDDRECPKRRIREGSSTVAEPAGGPSRSSGETPVIGVELVNMNAGSEAVMVGGGLVDCGAVREMEVVWPSRVVLRKKALNRLLALSRNLCSPAHIE